MPPAIVPHSDPRPPITTASNANSRCDGPSDGLKDDRIANMRPARATVPNAMAVAMP